MDIPEPNCPQTWILLHTIRIKQAISTWLFPLIRENALAILCVAVCRLMSFVSSVFFSLEFHFRHNSPSDFQISAGSQQRRWWWSASGLMVVGYWCSPLFYFMEFFLLAEHFCSPQVCCEISNSYKHRLCKCPLGVLGYTGFSKFLFFCCVL